jgi:hypothetical protein
VPSVLAAAQHREAGHPCQQQDARGRQPDDLGIGPANAIATATVNGGPETVAPSKSSNVAPAVSGSAKNSAGSV